MFLRDVADVLGGIERVGSWRVRARLGFPPTGIGHYVEWTAPEVAAAYVALALAPGGRAGAACGESAAAVGRYVHHRWVEAALIGAEPPVCVAAALGRGAPAVAAAWTPEAAWAAVAPLVAQGAIARYVRIPQEVARVPGP